MIGARRIAADPNSTDNGRPSGIEPEAATEHIHAANFLADEWIVGLSKIVGRSFIGIGGRDGIAFLQSKEAASGCTAE